MFDWILNLIRPIDISDHIKRGRQAGLSQWAIDIVIAETRSKPRHVQRETAQNEIDYQIKRMQHNDMAHGYNSDDVIDRWHSW